MKTKDIIVGFMIIVLLFASGCSTGKKYEPSITSKDIYSGKEGLKMGFFENTPPKEIFENSIMPIGVTMYNGGAYDIKRGYLSIGLEKEYMDIEEGSLKSINERADFRDPEHIQFDLTGKTIENPYGEQEIISFNANTKELSGTDPQSEYHDSLVSITACYEYKTTAVETVCIDTDVYGFKKREKSCEVKTLTLNSQGAPVAVTSIESEMVPSKDNPSIIKPRFLITVKNLGDGEVIKKERVVEACSSDPLSYKEWGNVNIKAYLSTQDEENKLDCDIVKDGEYDDGELVLKQKEDSIRCSYEKGLDETKGAFSSPLYILLEYGYTNTISKEVKIKKVLTH